MFYKGIIHKKTFASVNRKFDVYKEQTNKQNKTNVKSPQRNVKLKLWHVLILVNVISVSAQTAPYHNFLLQTVSGHVFPFSSEKQENHITFL